MAPFKSKPFQSGKEILSGEAEIGLSVGRSSEIFREALQQGWIRTEDTLVMVHDLDLLATRIASLQAIFSPGTLHALAIKANPLLKIQEFTRSLGTGAEAATIGEVMIALKAGYAPGMIVFDSPVKTEQDLAFAMEKGVYINCDNLTELKRVDKLLKNSSTTSLFGLRINPQVGEGSIAESSVAGVYSKFGVPLGTAKTELQEAFLAYPWLTGVHLHVGSQGCGLDLLLEGVWRVHAFAVEMNQLRKEKGLPPVHTLDIGGGLPVNYLDNESFPTLEDYATALSRIPHPASRITEFGRWVFVPSGFTVSRVEYVKHDPGVTTLMIHAGADLFVRECLNPVDWKHRYTLLDKDGFIKQGVSEHPCNLAGPLCFAGDMLAKGISLPEAEEGDYVIIHDTGGYTFSMWSRYNSRQTPRILGYKDGLFSVLKERETPGETVDFWG